MSFSAEQRNLSGQHRDPPGQHRAFLGQHRTERDYQSFGVVRNRPNDQRIDSSQAKPSHVCKRTLSMRHRALSEQHRACQANTLLSQLNKGSYLAKQGSLMYAKPTNSGPLRLLRGHPTARRCSLRPTEYSLGQIEGLDILMQGPCSRQSVFLDR